MPCARIRAPRRRIATRTLWRFEARLEPPSSSCAVATLTGGWRGLVRTRATVRPRLGALAEAVVRQRAYEKLGFRCLGDWSRERIGVGARAVREWARIWRALRELPLLRAAVVAGEVSWTVARKIVARATPENEAACLETVRGRTVRAVEAMIEAVRAAEAGAPGCEDAEGEERVRVRIPCPERLATRWAAAVELARRVSGEALSPWEAAEAIAAEAASAFAAPEIEEDARYEGKFSPPRASRPPDSSECGLRAVRWPWLRWAGPAGAEEPAAIEADLSDAAPLDLDRRFRQAIAFLQRVDLEIGRILRQILERGLHPELGFESFEDYVVERVDLSPRTARRLVRLARAPEALASAFREGRLTLLAAEAILRGAPHDETVTLRKLQEQTRAIDFWAPPTLHASSPRAGSSLPFPLRRPKVAIFAPKAGKAALVGDGPAQWRPGGANPRCWAARARAQPRSEAKPSGANGIGRFLSGDRKVADRAL